MYIESIKAANFKNYSSLKLEFSNNFNCILGKNGMGKTNLLDAIFYLGMCKSHFHIPDYQLVKEKEDFFRIDCQLKKLKKAYNVVAKVQPRKQKVFELDGKKFDRLSDYIGMMPLVMISPDDTIIGSGGSEERRRVMDETICQSDQKYLTYLIQYNKLLKQRNAALKSMAKSQRFDHQLIDAYDNQLIAPNNYIHSKRKEWLIPINEYFQMYYAKISGGLESPEIKYESTLNDSSIELDLKEARQKDCILARTTKGIHKDDLAFRLKGFTLKRFGSQGQLKSFILALKLAQYQWLFEDTSDKPILLLDDIFDKLDADRVRDLVALLSDDRFGQVFITDTGEQRLTNILDDIAIDYSTFRVADGVIEKK